MMEEKLKVAIIGAGISGLAAAYHLKKAGHDFKIFEAAHNLGGNVRTIPLNIDGVSRWVDLGVNDFNVNSYVNLKAVFDELDVEYAPLEDTISYSSIASAGEFDGQHRCYTMDGQKSNNPSQDVMRGIDMFGEAITRFLTELQDRDNSAMKYWTMDQFVKWANFPEEFIQFNLYPRINGMYFTDGIKPSEMPARQVASYYFLQEGYGTGKPASRQYWVGGAVRWINKLAAHLQKNLPQVIFKGTTAQFEIANDGKIIVHATPVTAPEGTPPRIEVFDKVILGVQARSIESIYLRKEQIPDVARQVIEKITYAEADSVVHTSTQNMPPDSNTWRTYNINLFSKTDEGQRYHITYWLNRHQNDPQSSKYCNHADYGQFFLSLNPLNPIPDKCKLKSQPFGNCTMFKFYHVRLDMAATRAQDELVPLMMRGIDNVHFTGGYTRGAGLHEECWVSGTEVAEFVLN